MADDGPPFELYRLDRDLSREEIIDALARMPSRFRAILAGVDAEMLTRSNRPGEWSSMETMRHVRDIAQVYGMRFKWIILQDEPLLANYEENDWAARSPDGPAELPTMLDEIVAYRAETIRLLRSLDDAGWRRTGRHETEGIVELEPYVRHQLAHEEQHLAQLGGALARTAT
jgi:hypothetical protein